MDNKVAETHHGSSAKRKEARPLPGISTLAGTPVWALRLIVLVLLIAAWWFIAVWIGRNFVPTPLATATAAMRLLESGTLVRATGQSLAVFFAGYGLAALVAIPLGLLMGGFRKLGSTLDVFANALTATPRVAFIPLIIIFLGLGFEAKVTIIFLGAVMPILINTYSGVLNSDGELIEMARSTGAGELAIFRKVMLPGSLRYIVAGLRLGAGIGLINTVVAELYTSVRGLGGLLSTYGNTFQMDNYFVVVLAFSVIGATVTQGLRLIEVRMDRWQYQQGRVA